jgi:hypothetical protein
MDQDETANDSTSDDVGGGVARRMSDSGEESATMTRTSISVAVCQQRARVPSGRCQRRRAGLRKWARRQLLDPTSCGARSQSHSDSRRAHYDGH